MLYNQRKRMVLEFLSTRQWVRVPVIAAAVGVHPYGGLYGPMKRLNRWAYVRRARDYRGQLVYKLSSRGANWLLSRRGIYEATT